MALQKQPVAINFVKGLDTKSDPFQVNVGNFLSLNNSDGTLTSWPFVTASSLVPLCLGFFYHSNHVGCWDESFQYRDEVDTRQFPVSTIFHFIVTGCYWFMKMGMDKYENNVALVKKLQSELLESKKTPKKKS